MQPKKGDMRMPYLKTRPYALRCHEGQNLRSVGALICVKANSDQTDGVFNLFDITCPPGFATELHIHYAEDVAFYVLEGTLSVFWGSEQQEAAAGAYFFQPRGTPHGFRVKGGIPARILYMSFPAGLDRFVARPEQLASCSEAMTSAAQYQIEILGPLPE
jgi:mannose-6-phosphate isomerase-like protein (cupin superfamily)